MSSVENVDPADLLEWTDRNPVIAAELTSQVDLPAVAIRDGHAWAVAFIRPTLIHGISVMLHGDDGSGELVSPQVAAALDELVHSAPFAAWLADVRTKGVDAISLPSTVEDLGGLLTRSEGRWEWMSSTAVPDPVTTVDPRELTADAHDEVQALLDAHNPGTDGQPFARSAQRWVGVRDGDRLIAVGCCEPERSGAPVLTGITVDPAIRGRGLGRAVTTELTRDAIAKHGWCTLGMYSFNDTARRIYLALGYEIGARWSSGELA